MKAISNWRIETVRVIVLLCIVLALLALIAINAISPLPIDVYSNLLWFVLGLALCLIGLRGLRQARVHHTYRSWHREPDILLSAGALFAVALSLGLHYLSHENMLTDAALLVVFGVPTIVLCAYSSRVSSVSVPRRKKDRSLI